MVGIEESMEGEEREQIGFYPLKPFVKRKSQTLL